MSDHWVITFESVHYVMKAEKMLKEHGFKIALIPTPREVSSDCGIAIELAADKLDVVKDLLQKNGVVPDKFYERKD